jgi:YfiH family protein
MALIYEPRIFAKTPGVRAALSLRGTTRPPFGFNMSLSVGDDEAAVVANRERLARRLGFAPERLAMQRQVHGDVIADVAHGYAPCESDAMMTGEEGWLLAVSVADCVPVLLYDDEHRAIAGVHSGWRGTARNIVGATIARMRERYLTEASKLRVYVGAAAGQCCYEVGEDVASAFDERYSRAIGGGKYLFDNKGRVLDQVLESGVDTGLVELDPRCTICNPGFHSYRRDGAKSGRMLAVIGMETGVAEGGGLEAA